MSWDRYTKHTLPTTTSSTAVATGARATIDLSAFINGYVEFRSTAAYAVRAASAAASLPTAGAMTADMPYSANTNERRFITRDTAHLAVYIASSGTFYWAKADG